MIYFFLLGFPLPHILQSSQLTRAPRSAHGTAWYYDAVNVSIAAVFHNGIISDRGYNAYPVLATPPIVPQSVWKQVNPFTSSPLSWLRCSTAVM